MDQRSDQPDPGAGGWARRVGEWLSWFGVARLVSSAIGVLLVAVGAVWLFRSPPPDVASGLAVATTTSTVDQRSDGSTTVASTAPEPETIVVHVTGAVRAAGVFELPARARVRDAVAAAGGPSAGADEALLNLAAPLVDGSRIEVPEVGDDVAVVMVPATSPADGPGVAPIDINRASATELEALPGVGPATAEAIVTERDTSGPFVSVDDVQRVPGIGPARLAALRDLIVT